MNRRTKIAITLSCVGLLAGLSACTAPSQGAKDTIEELVKKDIRQYYKVDVALSEPLKITYEAELGEELSEHNAKSVVLYKTTAFQFAYEDIVDEWLSTVWVKADADDVEISSVNYSRFYA